MARRRRLGRNLNGSFRAIGIGPEFKEQQEANHAASEALAALRATGRTTFEKGDEDEWASE